MNVHIREVAKEDIRSIGAVNREERIEEEYRGAPAADGMGLALKRVARSTPLEVDRWDEDDLDHRVGLWGEELEKGGVLLGAFDSERLVGFVVLGHTWDDGTAELSAIFVDKDYRRRSIGALLIRAAEEKAAERRIRGIYIMSVATAGTVDFYLRLGYQVVSIVDKSLVTHLPWDVVLAKKV